MNKSHFVVSVTTDLRKTLWGESTGDKEVKELKCTVVNDYANIEMEKNRWRTRLPYFYYTHFSPTKD